MPAGYEVAAMDPTRDVHRQAALDRLMDLLTMYAPTQIIMGLLMRRDGLPVACEIWPGNPADVTRLTVIAKILKEPFNVGKVVVVCDREMVSKKNLAAMTEAKFEYIVGAKMRGFLEVRDEVLGRAGRYMLTATGIR